MRDSASVIVCPLTHVINLSISQGVVLDDLMSAMVVPLFKENEKTEVGIYQPVSISSIISKVFERVAYDQVEACLDQKKTFVQISVRF